jgi:hypothetical protein
VGRIQQIVMKRAVIAVNSRLSGVAKPRRRLTWRTFAAVAVSYVIAERIRNHYGVGWGVVALALGLAATYVEFVVRNRRRRRL